MSDHDQTDPPPASGSGSTSSGLLQRVKAQDPEAWRRMVRLYGPLVFLWCRRLGLPRDDAADVAQDVWTAVARSISDFQRRPPDTFRGWLFTVTRSKVADWHRSGEARAVGGSTAQWGMAQIPEITADSVALTPSEKDIVMRHALASIRSEFEDRTWQAFWRTAVDGRAAADVATELGMAPGAVRQAKYRVLRRLRDELEGLVE